MRPQNKLYLFLVTFFIIALACNAPTTVTLPTEEAVQPEPTAIVEAPPATDAPLGPSVTHVQFPAVEVGLGRAVYDTESSGTAPEKRAPYGDTYDQNFLERPFLSDMTYVPDLDIHFFSMSRDDTWHYVSIKLIGSDPNNSMGIMYAVELDTDRDGYGNFIVTAQPPYSTEWTTENVRVLSDENRNTSGASPARSDAPLTADGYETVLFDGSQGIGEDPDLAWVRLVNNSDVTLQFAFKRPLVGDVFMAGVLADAGLKDVSQLDYVDRFTEAEAGSPVRSKQTYPLKSLFSVDNTCREAFGFASTGYEPMICPKNVAPAAGGGGGGNDSNNPGSPPPTGCMNISQNDCTGDAPFFWPYPHCACSSTPFYENTP